MLSRNNEYIVFYRGKDFLSSELAEVLIERERLAKSLQDEEQARLKAVSSFSSSIDAYVQPTLAGTLEETLEANSKYGNKLDEDHADKMARTVAAARHADLVRKLEWKLALVSDPSLNNLSSLCLNPSYLRYVFVNKVVFLICPSIFLN